MAVVALSELRIILDGEFLPDCNDVKLTLDKLVTAIHENGVTARKEAIEINGYQSVVQAWAVFCDTGEDNIKVLSGDATIIREAVLRALSVLTPGNPTIIDRMTFVMLVQAFDSSVPESTKIEALKVMRNICIKCETNREALTSEWNIIRPFVEIIHVDNPSNEFIRQWCGALRAFTLNDDTSVAYNRSAQRKRKIFDLDGINYLASFLTKSNEETLNSILVAITMMATHEEYCVAMEAAGVISGLELIFQNYSSNDRLIINTINCIRYLCVSGIVRGKMENTLLVKYTLEAVGRFKENAECMEIVTTCLAFMTLRCPCGAAQFLSEHGVTIILNLMKKYMENPSILKACCLLLRNVASLSGILGRLNILEAGGEAVLRQVMEKHEQLAENHVKPALKDLGFEITFNKPGSEFIPQELNPSVGVQLAPMRCSTQQPSK